MEPARRTRIVLLVSLVLAAWLPGTLYAGCDACPLATVGSMAGGPSGGAPRVAPPCCPQNGASPAIRANGCCSRLRTAVPAETSRAVAPPSPSSFSPAPPAALPGAPAAAEPIAEPPLSPPLLHDGVGLYTLHAAFLI
jgi:hypothetical protein